MLEQTNPKPPRRLIPPGYELNEHGLAVPTMETLQNVLGEAKNLNDFFGREGLLARLLKTTIESAMEAEMSGTLGYPKHMKTGTPNHRNGYNTKQLKTSLGEIGISVPRDRQAEYEPQIVKKHQTKANDLEQKIIAMYAYGNTTRDIQSQLAEMYGIEVSPEYISNAVDKISPLVREWQSRPLSAIYPIVYLDAVHFKIRDNGKISSKAINVALGIDIEGRKEVLGIYISENEGAKFWMQALTDLQQRGVKDILIACVDGLSGFKEAIAAVFPQTLIQRCVIHQIRRSLSYVGWKHKKEFMADLKRVYQALNEEMAMDSFLQMKAKWHDQYAIAIRGWEDNWNELLAYMKFSPEIRRLIYTTNILENLNRHFRKLTKNRLIFPNDESALRALFLGIERLSERWTAQTRDWGKILNQLAIHFHDRI
jgi:putative transposase